MRTARIFLLRDAVWCSRTSYLCLLLLFLLRSDHRGKDKKVRLPHPLFFSLLTPSADAEEKLFFFFRLFFFLRLTAAREKRMMLPPSFLSLPFLRFDQLEKLLFPFPALPFRNNGEECWGETSLCSRVRHGIHPPLPPLSFLSSG